MADSKLKIVLPENFVADLEQVRNLVNERNDLLTALQKFVDAVEPVDCPGCGGTGQDQSDLLFVCDLCGGNGAGLAVKHFPLREVYVEAMQLIMKADMASGGVAEPDEPAMDYRCQICGAPITAAEADDNGGLCGKNHPIESE